MVSFLEKFSVISQVEYKKCTDLNQNTQYNIDTLENVSTKYGESLVATLQNPDRIGTLIKVYLPKRYAGKFTNEELANITPNRMKLIYRGQKGNTSDIEIIQ